MPIINGKDVRFIALPYSRNEIAIGKELMVDYENGILYVKSKDGKRNIQLGRYTLIDKSSLRFKELMGNVEEDYNTLKKMERILEKFVEWKKEITKDSDVDNIINILNDLFSLYNDYGGNLKLKDLLNLKVDKEPGKGLSTNDFTNELKHKLDNIEEKANNYKHPTNQVCNYKMKIKKINNQTGKVILNKETLGLGQVPDIVKKYIHPNRKQCNEKVVTGINSNHNNEIDLDKFLVNLGNVIDQPMYHYFANTINYPYESKVQPLNYHIMTPTSVFDFYLSGNYHRMEQNFIRPIIHYLTALRDNNVSEYKKCKTTEELKPLLDRIRG